MTYGRAATLPFSFVTDSSLGPIGFARFSTARLRLVGRVRVAQSHSDVFQRDFLTERFCHLIDLDESG